MYRRLIIGFLSGGVALTAGIAVAGSLEDAAKAFAEGQVLLAKADFTGALQAFKTAAKADPESQEYRRQQLMVRQIMRIRRDLEEEQDPTRWLGMARAVRSFYHAYDLYSEALPIDVRIHDRHPTPDSAAMLAEAQLALGMYTAAAETLGALDAEKATPRTKVLTALALARQGKITEARALAMKLDVKKDAGPRVYYELACLRALIGDSKGAFAALARSFELTSPSRLDAAKAAAKACKDFRKLVETAPFAKVLETQSKLKGAKSGKGADRESSPKRAGDDGGVS